MFFCHASTSLQSILRRFIKIDLLRDATPARLVRLDVTEKEATVPVRAIDIGIGAENAIKVFMGQCFSFAFNPDILCKFEFLKFSFLLTNKSEKMLLFGAVGLQV